jgi:hypothetical protein
MSKNEIQLMMPIIEEKPEERTYHPSGGIPFSATSFPISVEQIQDLVKGFKDFNLDTIELHVKGVAQTDGITKLFIGLSGEAGVKLLLKKDK